MRRSRTAFTLISISIISLLSLPVWGTVNKPGAYSHFLLKIAAASQPSETSQAVSSPSSAGQDQPEKTPSTPFGPKTMPPSLRNRMESQPGSPMGRERRQPRTMPGWPGTTNMEVKDFDGDNKPDVIILRGNQLLVINNKGAVILNMELPEPAEK